MSHQQINQSSLTHEFYSPPIIVSSVHRVMGYPDLDPSSCAKANKNIKAAKYFTRGQNGLSKKWTGKVWMNHPWGARETACKNKCLKKVCKIRGYHLKKDFPGNAAWVDKLIQSYTDGSVTQAMCITYASTSEKWFIPLTGYAMCFLHGRTSFLSPADDILNQNTKGCVVTYLGDNVQKFDEEFRKIGSVMLPYNFRGIHNANT